MRLICLLTLGALALPALARDQGTYKGTLGPVESVKVTFESDRRIKIERERTATIEASQSDESPKRLRLGSKRTQPDSAGEFRADSSIAS